MSCVLKRSIPPCFCLFVPEALKAVFDDISLLRARRVGTVNVIDMEISVRYVFVCCLRLGFDDLRAVRDS